MAIFMEAPQQRKGRSVDALKKAGEHPAVITAVARLFWNERKVEKARQWFGNAITADQDWGDAWGWWLKFERQHGELVSVSLLLFPSPVGDCEAGGARGFDWNAVLWRGKEKDESDGELIT